MIQTYTLIHVDNDHEIFVKVINQHLREGWELWMNHAVVSYQVDGLTYFIYTQAMVRYDDPPLTGRYAVQFGQESHPFGEAEIGAVAEMVAPLVAGLGVVPVRTGPLSAWTMAEPEA